MKKKYDQKKNFRCENFRRKIRKFRTRGARVKYYKLEKMNPDAFENWISSRRIKDKSLQNLKNS